MNKNTNPFKGTFKISIRFLRIIRLTIFYKPGSTFQVTTLICEYVYLNKHNIAAHMPIEFQQK